MKDRIRKLLINGLKASEVAQVVGCSPSYVSQLIKDTDFKAEVEAGMVAAQVEHTEEEHIDTRYQNLEHKLLTAAEGALVEASLGEITRAIETINKRADMKHARKNPAPVGTAVQINVVSLQLPHHALEAISKPVITINEQKEIIAISGKSLAPMSSDAVKELFASRMALAASRVPEVVTIEEL